MSEYVRAKKAMLFGSERAQYDINRPLDILFAGPVSHINEAQYQAGGKLEELRAAVFGLASPRAAPMERMDRGQPEHNEPRDERLQREYDLATAALGKAGSRARTQVVSVIVYRRLPRFTRAWHVRASDRADLEALKAGLSALVDHFHIGRKRVA